MTEACPRCKGNLNPVKALNAMSRIHKGVRICSKCGDEEALIQNGFMEEDEKHRVWLVTKR